jgi:hypothetical protein
MTRSAYTKRVMARVFFCERVEAEEASDALRKAGYVVDFMGDELIEDFDSTPTHVFVEAWKDVPLDADNDAIASAILDEVDTIIELDGFCSDVGVVPPDHVPHHYDTPHWRASRH